jgi:hypothetical protein
MTFNKQLLDLAQQFADQRIIADSGATLFLEDLRPAFRAYLDAVADLGIYPTGRQIATLFSLLLDADLITVNPNIPYFTDRRLRPAPAQAQQLQRLTITISDLELEHAQSVLEIAEVIFAEGPFAGRTVITLADQPAFEYDASIPETRALDFNSKVANSLRDQVDL